MRRGQRNVRGRYTERRRETQRHGVCVRKRVRGRGWRKRREEIEEKG